MAFNKNTWSKDYTGARGLKLLAAADAVKKGFAPKHARRAVSADARPVAEVAEPPKRPARP